MEHLLAVGLGLVAWPLLSYTFPTLVSQIPLGTFTHAPPTASTDSVITTPLSTFIEQTMALQNITGLSVAVIFESGETEFKSFGYRSEDGEMVTSDTMFNMASVSKAFCGTAIGLLIDDFSQGNNVTALPSGLTEFTWHTPVVDLLPDWQLMDEFATRKANLLDILSHVSGIPRHDFAYGPTDTPEAVIMRLNHLRPAFEIRERWSYNNIMFMVAAHVIETYSGQSYTSFVEERIFAPLGMMSSTFSPAKAKVTGKLTQGWSKAGRRVPEAFTEQSAFLMDGPGGIISNSVDMAKWISAWISEGLHGNQTVIPATVYRNVSYSYSVSSDHPPDPNYSIVGYGAGWFRSSYRGHDIVYHAGALPWLSTLVAFLPADKIGVTLFANGQGKAQSLTLIQNRILDSALGLSSSLTPVDTQSRPSSREVGTTELGGAQNLSLPLDAFAGVYTNPGYGSFTLCSPSSISSHCATIHSDFSAIDTMQGDPGTDDLLAEWPRIWSSHIRLRHQQGSIFGVYFTTLFPDGWGKDTTPFETCDSPESRSAEFVIEDGKVVGFGLSGFVGEQTERSRTYEAVRDRAEVWFDKV